MSAGEEKYFCAGRAVSFWMHKARPSDRVLAWGEDDPRQDPITAFCFSSDDKLLLTGSKQGRLMLWEREKARLLRELKGHGDVIIRVAFCPNQNDLFASASFDGTARLWHREHAEENGLVGTAREPAGPQDLRPCVQPRRRPCHHRRDARGGPSRSPSPTRPAKYFPIPRSS